MYIKKYEAAVYIGDAFSAQKRARICFRLAVIIKHAMHCNYSFIASTNIFQQQKLLDLQYVMVKYG